MTLDLAVIPWMWHQRQRQQKEKIDKFDFMKIKDFYPSQDTINRVKATDGIGNNVCKSYV